MIRFIIFIQQDGYGLVNVGTLIRTRLSKESMREMYVRAIYPGCKCDSILINYVRSIDGSEILKVVEI